MIISKRITLTILCCLFSVLEIFAQNKDSLKFNGAPVLVKKFYYQVGFGYNFSSGIGMFESHIETRDGSYSSEAVNASYGKGVDLSLAFGGKFNNNFGLEVEFGGIIGSANTVQNQYYVLNAPYVPFLDKQENNYRANTFRFNPKLVFEVPFEGVNAFYGKIGYMVGFGNAKRVANEDIFFDSGVRGKGNFEWNYTGGVVTGSTISLGLRFNVEKDLSFFMEVTGNSLHRSFKKATMTTAVVGDQNILPSLTVYSKETVYVDKATYTSASQNADQPNEAPSYRSNYNTAGFRIGIIKHF